MTLWFLVINSALMSVCNVVFVASNKELMTTAMARRSKRKWLAFIVLLLSLAQTCAWFTYSLMSGNWMFFLIVAFPFVVAMFERTLRRKTALAVPEIEEKVGERLNIGGRMFELVRVQSHNGATAVGFVDSRSLQKERTVY